MKFLRMLVIFVALIGLTASTVHAQKEIKIGFVDLSRLFDEYYKTKEYDQKLEAEQGDFEKIRNEKIEGIRESQGKLGLLTEDKKAEVEENIENMKADLLEFDRQQKQDLTKKRNEKIREILLEIEKVVSDYAEKEDFSVILNDRVLIYGSQTFDLTEQVLKILNGPQS